MGRLPLSLCVCLSPTFFCLSCLSPNQNRIICYYAVVCLCLIMLSLLYSAASLTLAAGCLQLLLRYNSDSVGLDSVGTVWDHIATWSYCLIRQ